MPIIATYLLPHPPLIFPEIGHGQERKIRRTIAAYKDAARQIAEFQPDTVVIVSPHARSFADAFVLPSGEKISGDMGEFDAPDVKLTLDIDAEFVDELLISAQDEDLPVVKAETESRLDHATIVPARFIAQATTGKNIQYVTTGITNLPLSDHFALGELVTKTAEKLNRRVVFIASGDLSHRLKDDGPYGFNSQGPVFDKKICEIVENADFDKLFDMSEQFCDDAGECGHRPLCVMSGVIGPRSVDSRLLSYEGPFGVGYGVASFVITKSPLVKLAQVTVENYVRNVAGFNPTTSDITGLNPTERAGVFVSIKKLGELRGCIGTTAPTTENIAAEIIQNAISAASQDPRFQPITADELPLLTYSVDVLNPPQPIDNIDQLDPHIYGVIVSHNGKQGLLLPNLDGIDIPEEQIKIAMQKAEIPPQFFNQIKLQCFTVKRYY
jgi:AmmeMemoRadiSam system protein A/AmmeMemoRadiSam system protein B